MTKNEKIKNLTVTELKKQVKKLDKQTEATVFVEIDSEKTPYNFKYDEFFKNTKIHLLLDDMVEFFNRGYVDSRLLELSTPYISLLIIKHFTSIEISDDIDEALSFLNVLTDLEILAPIINCLPEKEIIKLEELLAKTLDNLERNIELAEDEELVMLDEIENDSVKEVILDGQE